ncbi:MAG: hypothetical protein GX138_08100 [Firmicutes bacterium]|nr:hypothetical protein [Bacillota bacterium]
MKMKKNLVFRLGLLALVLTLVTMPLVSGTYAKYVTSEVGTAQARVAKWGVEIDVDVDDLFGAAYEDLDGGNGPAEWIAVDDNPDYAGITVNASTNTYVLAPGTKGSMTFDINGQPEVAVSVKVEAGTEEGQIVTLTGWDYEIEEVTYTPVVFKVNNESKTLAELNSYFEDLYEDYDPNTNLSDEFDEVTIEWEWPFDSGNDVGDTYYGDKAETPTIKFDLKVTVTQID